MPDSPVDLGASSLPAAKASSSGGGGGLGKSTASTADRWAVGALAASGEEVLGRIYLPQYLLLALSILLPPLGVQFRIPTALHRLT